MERTLSIIKPDCVARCIIGEVIKKLEDNEIKIIAMKMLRLTKAQAEGFYAVHKERPFFESLTDFMTSGPVVAMVLEGENVIDKYRKGEQHWQMWVFSPILVLPHRAQFGRKMATRNARPRRQR